MLSFVTENVYKKPPPFIPQRSFYSINRLSTKPRPKKKKTNPVTAKENLNKFPTASRSMPHLGRTNTPGRKLSNAIKHFLARVKCQAQQFKSPKFESGARGPQGLQSQFKTKIDQSGDFSHAEQAQQPAHQRRTIQAAKHPVEPGHQEQDNQAGSLHAFNPFGRTQDAGYVFAYKDPGPPDGFITEKDGSQIPFWWNPPGIQRQVKV